MLLSATCKTALKYVWFQELNPPLFIFGFLKKHIGLFLVQNLPIHHHRSLLFITYYFIHISVFHSYSSKACYETINYLSCSIHIKFSSLFHLLRQNIPICRAWYVLEQSYYFSVKWEIGHICRKLWTYFCHRNCVNVSKKKHNTTKKAATFATVVVQHKSMASIF